MKKTMLKKTIACFLCIVLLAALSGCDINGSPVSSAPESTPEAANSTAESSAAESPPTTDTPTAEPTVTPTSETSSAPQTTADKLDYTALTSDAKSYLGDHFEEYGAFVNAIVSGKESFEFSDTSAKKAILSVINNFPLYILCNPFDTTPKELSTPIVYRDGLEEFKKQMATFDTEALKLLSAASAGSNKTEKAVYLYGAVASLSYNSSDPGDVYSLVTAHSGSAFAFSGTLSFLLSQCGVDNLLASGTTSTGKEHRWVIITIENRSFNMDPTYENGGSGGKGLRYFALSDKGIEKAGTFTPYSTGESAYFKKGQDLCTDESLDRAFKSSTSWKLEGGILYLGSPDSDGFTSTVKTDTLTIID